MGNQLVALAPSQIFPVEHYLTGTCELELQFEKSMGSTRFMKVAKVKVDEGPVVVKVFVRHDPSLPLEQHLERIEYIKKHLANAVNCLPFQKVLTMEKSCLILREFVKHSLYDRVSTRPFLTLIEKKWITFQILCALHQCHKQHICHGDIKLENILITSWNWVLLSDFASFKPTYLPEDNPADYSYFFDTSRRRTCYIAPERFVLAGSGPETVHPKDGPLVGDGQSYCGGQLLPEMDIFSAGCALLELWTEGTAPFEFSQLLAYRRGEEDLVHRHLAGIENGRLRELIRSMLCREAAGRKSAELYLDQERGHLFPVYFYAFLQSYLQMFSTVPVVPPDEKIARLHADIRQIVQILTGGTRQFTTTSDSALDPGACGDGPPNKEGPEDGHDNDGLILITSVVTACIRGLCYCKSKLLALQILQTLAENTTSETILDRILPYILNLAQDAEPRVRVSALNTLTACLQLVRHLPRSDANVFPEYILPAIAPLATDSSTYVRMTYAKNIATLAETAVGFLEQSQQMCELENVPPPHYETELSALHEMLHQTVLALLTDPQSTVKQTLMESGITKLCVFFGRQKANDVILSHMITFLNDKEDRNLRGAFFGCIVGVASFVGHHCSPMLVPLLQQGLTDPEEFVIAKAIHATTLLIEIGLIQKQGTIEFIGECACYLSHPNLWIRHEVVELIATAARISSSVDVQCKVKPSIANHLKFPLIDIEAPDLLLDALVPPVSRPIYDAVLRAPDIGQLMSVLRNRKAARYHQTGHSAVAPDAVIEVPVAVRNLFRRLVTDGLTAAVEAQLLAMETHLVKLHRYKLAAETRLVPPSGCIVLDYFPDLMEEISLAGGDVAQDVGKAVAAEAATAVTLKAGARRLVRNSESDNGPNGYHVLTTVETQLLAMETHLVKLHGFKLAPAARLTPPSGCIEPNCFLDAMDEISPTVGSDVTQSVGIVPSRNGVKQLVRKGQSVNSHNGQHMLIASSKVPSPISPAREASGAGTGVGPAAVGSSGSGTAGTHAPTIPTSSSARPVEYSMPERTTSCTGVAGSGTNGGDGGGTGTAAQDRVTSCRQELDALVSKLRNRYATYQHHREWRESNAVTPPLPTGWTLGGKPVAHLQEHQGAVSRLAALKPHAGPLFASASIDGTVRLWDCNKLDGQQSVNKSRQSYHARTPLHAVAACDAGQSLAVAGRDGTLLLLKIDTNSSKMALQQARHLEPDVRQLSCPFCWPNDYDGPVVEMAPLETHGAQSVIVYATLYGTLVGWDIRTPDPAWQLQSDLRSGVITTFCIDPTSSWLTVGTSSGRHICWDLRFQLPIAEIKHPNDARVRRVSHHPTESSWLVSALQGNNEVSVWNIETGHRQQTFWASPNPPLSHSSASTQCVCAMVQGIVDDRPFLLTGGADQRIRYWDPLDIDKCSLIVPSAKDYAPLNIRYESRLIDGTKVISEDSSGVGGGAGTGGNGSTVNSTINNATANANAAINTANTTSSSSTNNNTTSLVAEAIPVGSGAGSSSGGGERTMRSDSGPNRTESDDPRTGPDMPSIGHNDVINDMLMCRTAKQTFLVSASRDGVIKLWK
ncbi:phosphoinositide 3-kinase regulatory subunit 4-like [Anopheles cruzii]|uniref:phosphoinositide 3-kinase regulatory subunit 4-like n=1 Tax=Anopheles cruzii TaxID=68878 RepID=UPI0022EC4E78|nr:phosphoinositide 3-kinase regulatory subunit 4-like [Anopheles cruzii]